MISQNKILNYIFKKYENGSFGITEPDGFAYLCSEEQYQEIQNDLKVQKLHCSLKKVIIWESELNFTRLIAKEVKIQQQMAQDLFRQRQIEKNQQLLLTLQKNTNILLNGLVVLKEDRQDLKKKLHYTPRTIDLNLFTINNEYMNLVNMRQIFGISYDIVLNYYCFYIDQNNDLCLMIKNKKTKETTHYTYRSFKAEVSAKRIIKSAFMQSKGLSRSLVDTDTVSIGETLLNYLNQSIFPKIVVSSSSEVPISLLR